MSAQAGAVEVPEAPRRDVDEHQALGDLAAAAGAELVEQLVLFGEPSAPAPVTAEQPPDPGLLRDPRQMAFSVTGRGAAGLLRATFDRKRLTTARAIYEAFAELASDARSSEFRATRECVAGYAGVSDRTVDVYARKFETIGLLEVVRPRGGRHHQANLWRLLQVPGDARGEANRTPSDSRGEAISTPNDARGEANRTPVLKKKERQEGNVFFLPPHDRSRRGDSSHFDVGVRR